MRCDAAIREPLELLDSCSLIEEVLNSVFGKYAVTPFYARIDGALFQVFIIRFAERKIDELLDAALLDYSPLSTEFESVQFESEWSFLRSFGSKKKMNNNSNGLVTPSPAGKNGYPSTSSPSSRPSSPTPSVTLPTSKQGSFASLRQSFARTRGGPATAPLQSLFNDATSSVTPKGITSFMTALHTFLTLSDINPAIITQFWSQVMYWTACALRGCAPYLRLTLIAFIGETFNRILTRKKYLCRLVTQFLPVKQLLMSLLGIIARVLCKST